MATPTLEELFTAQTAEQIEASFLQVATQVGLPATAWQPVSIGREVAAILCALIAEYTSGASTTAAAAGLLDYASGEWLRLTGEQRFATPFVEATYGSCSCRLTNTVATPQTWAPADLRALNPSSGYTYLNTTGGTLPGWFGVGAYPTLDLDFQAETAGSAASSAAGEISELASPLAGVLIANVTPAVGTDAIGDPAYKELCRESIARLSPNGPQDAYNYFAKTTVRGDGTNAGVTRTRVVQPVTMPGTLFLYLASDAGAVAPSDVALVQTNILANCTPTGIVPTSVSAETYSLLVTATAYLRLGSTATAESIAAAMYASLLEFFRALPIGGTVIVNGDVGYVFLEMVISALANASDEIVQVELTNLSQDVPLATNQVAVLASAAASFSVVQTS